MLHSRVKQGGFGMYYCVFHEKIFMIFFVFAPPALVTPPPHPSRVAVRWCVSLLNTPAVLPRKRLKDGGGMLGVRGWSATVVIT